MSSTPDDRPSWREFAWTMGIFLVVVVLSAVLAHRRAPTPGSVQMSAVATAAGTLVMALWLSRHTRYPRWGFVGAAVVLAASVLASTRAFPDPRVWIEAVRPGLWLHPWFFLVMSWSPGPTRGWCAPSSPFAGWMLIGTGLVLAGISLGAGWVTTRF